MRTKTFLATLGLLAAGTLITGCENGPPSTTAPVATQASDDITPMGDSLHGPIPYPHWPYNIAQGGGGGATR